MKGGQGRTGQGRALQVRRGKTGQDLYLAAAAVADVAVRARIAQRPVVSLRENGL